MAAARQGERWLALELVVVMIVRTVHGFSEQGELLGAKNYAAMFTAFGFLSILALSDQTAELAAMLGLLLVLAVLLRPTARGVLGSDTAHSVSAFTENVAANPPTVTHGFSK